MSRKLFFSLQYWFDNPPWDTGTTPPEVYKFLDENPPGKALDLGCGTGTNAITMAEYGWHTTGIDFVSRAIRIARRKVRQRSLQDRAIFFVGDVLAIKPFLEKFDLVLDVGCFHGFSGADVEKYVQTVSSQLSSGGSLLLYVHLNKNPGPGHGATEADLTRLGESLSLKARVNGEESSRPSAWLHFQKE